MRIFLCGDVMIGRGVDQILPNPCPPALHEACISSALGYVGLAEHVSGRIIAPVDLDYIWGAALDLLRQRRPDARIVNLETSITRSEAYEAKGINYRVSPENAECLRRAGIDCCVLANNHVLDWGRAGLLDTLHALERLQIKTAGAGRNLRDAQRPAILEVAGEGRLLVVSFASPCSGAPPHWAATGETPGVNLLEDLSARSADRVCATLGRTRKPGDALIVSLHWGGNWGYDITNEQRCFAHRLIDDGGASIVHGHSSHHPKAMEIYRNRLILYGCGDFLNDYEGIEGYERFRGDLALMYLADLDAQSGDLTALELAPMQIRRFRLEPAAPPDADWLARALDRESAPLGLRVRRTSTGLLSARAP